jgi:NADPH2:quinone reductase
VTGFEEGQPVATLTINTGGAYGQVAVTHRDLVIPLPPGMDPALAAVVPSNPTTALIALERVAHL